MKNKVNIKMNSTETVEHAFENYILDASDEELDEIIREMGEDRNKLLLSANNAIKKAFSLPSELKTKKNVTDESNFAGFQAMIELLRKEKKLSQGELANAARVSIEDIKNIEEDVSFIPSPRTMHQLEQFFNLKPRTLALVSGAILAHSSEFQEEVVRFAAHSKEIRGLNKEEKKLLNDFISVISNELKKT